MKLEFVMVEPKKCIGKQLNGTRNALNSILIIAQPITTLELTMNS